MFDFEKLIVYKKARLLNKELYFKVLRHKQLDKNSISQLDRAATSIMLNISEGAGRFTNPDKRNFYVISRGSVFECIAVLQKSLDKSLIDKATYDQLYQLAEQISKMLYRMISDLK